MCYDLPPVQRSAWSTPGQELLPEPRSDSQVRNLHQSAGGVLSLQAPPWRVPDRPFHLWAAPEWRLLHPSVLRKAVRDSVRLRCWGYWWVSPEAVRVYLVFNGAFDNCAVCVSVGELVTCLGKSNSFGTRLCISNLAISHQALWRPHQRWVGWCEFLEVCGALK